MKYLIHDEKLCGLQRCYLYCIPFSPFAFYSGNLNFKKCVWKMISRHFVIWRFLAHNNKCLIIMLFICFTFFISYTFHPHWCLKCLTLVSLVQNENEWMNVFTSAFCWKCDVPRSHYENLLELKQKLLLRIRFRSHWSS